MTFHSSSLLSVFAWPNKTIRMRSNFINFVYKLSCRNIHLLLTYNSSLDSLPIPDFCPFFLSMFNDTQNWTLFVLLIELYVNVDDESVWAWMSYSRSHFINEVFNIAPTNYYVVLFCHMVCRYFVPVHPRSSTKELLWKPKMYGWWHCFNQNVQ
jgi:hypothetical protein